LNTPTHEYVVPKSIPITGALAIFRTVNHQIIGNCSNDILKINLSKAQIHESSLANSYKEHVNKICYIHLPVRAINI
jgi:hypothetical protein